MTTHPTDKLTLESLKEFVNGSNDFLYGAGELDTGLYVEKSKRIASELIRYKVGFEAIESQFIRVTDERNEWESRHKQQREEIAKLRGKS
jgi:hypothetical protein